MGKETQKILLLRKLIPIPGGRKQKMAEKGGKYSILAFSRRKRQKKKRVEKAISWAQKRLPRREGGRRRKRAADFPIEKKILERGKRTRRAPQTVLPTITGKGKKEERRAIPHRRGTRGAKQPQRNPRGKGGLPPRH